MNRLGLYVYVKRMLFIFLLLASALHNGTAQTAAQLLENGGFEDVSNGNITLWEAYEGGFQRDSSIFRRGSNAIRMENFNTGALRGARVVLTLNQKRPVPVHISGWSKADGVSGTADTDYALYADIQYTDGTFLYGQAAPFEVGTHDWERRQVLIFPEKPIKSLSLYALFRRHVGTVWFDDLSAYQIEGKGIFDSQAQSIAPRPAKPSSVRYSVTSRDGLAVGLSANGDIASLKVGGKLVSGNNGGGFYVRDVAAEGKPVPVRGRVGTARGGGYELSATPYGLRMGFYAKIVRDGNSILVDGIINDVSKRDRAVTVYFALPVQAVGWLWGDDIRTSRRIQSQEEYHRLTNVNVGANGGISLYPYASVSSNSQGVGIANQMDMPNVYRIFYHAPTRQLVIAWDFALTAKTGAWLPHNARFRCYLFRLSPEESRWGFRAATRKFYGLNAAHFERRATQEGIWIPFTNPAHVKGAEDFHFAYHEGDNSVRTDDEKNILSFRYSEPMTWWMKMPAGVPRTYDAAIAQVQRMAEDKGAVNRQENDLARAVLSSGAQDEKGRYRLHFRKEPWADGAVFILNPNPEIPFAPDKPTRASITYTITDAFQRYGADSVRNNGELDGEYLDSLETWADALDYRPSHLKTIPYPLTFETNSRLPVLPHWFSTHTFARFVSNDLRNRSKLLMANATPIRYSIFAPLFDVMGIEVNWLSPEGKYQPEADATMNLRRTLSAKKPYLLLQNTNYDKFDRAMVEKYVQRAMFYGIYPSMFSVDAASNPYWDNPKWYDRDREVFKTYIPIIKRLSAAGWEPVTHALSNNPAVSIERFGTEYFTLLNPTNEPHYVTITIARNRLALPASASKAVDLRTGKQWALQSNGSNLLLNLQLQPDETIALVVQ